MFEGLWWLVPVVLTIAGLFGFLQGTCALLILLERKISAWVQDRIGPNRVGPFGLLQPVADGVKFVLKEEVIPSHVDKVLFILAPCIAMGTATLAFAFVPFGGPTDPADAYQFILAPNIDIGLIFVFAVGSLAVYGIILGGWSANNKYAMLGSLRSSAQIVSYEIPLGLSVLGVALMSGTLNLEEIIWHQARPGHGVPMWNVVYQPLAFLIFMIASFAECNRLPFDLPEAEQELVGGYHTEYSAMKFAFFFLGEYTHMITTSFLMVVIFWGGWHFPFLATADSHWTLKLGVMLAKVAVFLFWYILIRWTIPRFRFDQLMSLAWKVLIPLALVNLVVVMVVLEIQRVTQVDWLVWTIPVLTIAALVVSGVVGAEAAEPRSAVDLPTTIQGPSKQVRLVSPAGDSGHG